MPLKLTNRNNVSTAPTGNSVLFNGSNQYLTASRTGGWLKSANNFTLECWVYFTRHPSSYGGYYYSCIAGTADNSTGWELNFGGNGSTTTSLGFSIKQGGGPGIVRTFNINTWYHIAVVRSGTTVTLYIDGTSANSTTISSWTENTQLKVGALNLSPYLYYFPGYISNFRIIDGTALYTANFTPPISTLTAITNTALLTCNAATIIDGSTNNFTITNNGGATVSSVIPFVAIASKSNLKFANRNNVSSAPTGNSVLFNGTNQYLSVASNAAFNFGTGDFTFELWAYHTNLTGQQTYIGDTYGNTEGIYTYKTSNNEISLYDTAQRSLSATNVIKLNTWHHIVWTRQSGTLRSFVDGVLVASNTYAGSFTVTQYYIGDTAGTSSGPMNGYISNVRILKGTALYTSNFTPSTSPLTAIANTSLLTCQSPTIIDNSTNNFTITNNGGATVSSAVPFVAIASKNTMVFKKSYADPISPYIIATGGDLITISGSYKIHQFTTVGTSSFVVSSAGINSSIEYLVVGGGGGGGYVAGAYDSRGGGGGAGGFRTGSISSGIIANNYSVIVGAGGSLNNNGKDSSFMTVTSLGGGGGGFESTAAKIGGSGGGGGARGSAGNFAGAAGTVGQGNSGGGGGTDSSTYRYGGGGGGASSAGVTAINSSTACVGGAGAYSNIAGTNVPYAGGGGGGQHLGGVGGGGAGSGTGGVANGSANTGGGGGGGLTTYQYANYPGGSGGSGVVIIKYRYAADFAPVPNIITNGLVLNIDASNVSSYPGTGTTWTDLSGNGNNGTLTNGPIYTGSFGGGIKFDGVDDYISIGSQNIVGTGTSAFTGEIWWYNNRTLANGDYIMPIRIKQDSEFFVALYNPSGTYNLYATFRGNTQFGIPVTNSDYINKWICMQFVYTGGNKSTASSYKFYINGTQIAIGSNNYGPAGGTLSNCNIIGSDGNNGCNASYSGILRGTVASYRLYTGELTAAQLLQNYNATKARFGL